MLNLVDGEAAVVESPDARFEPYALHYAETLILPPARGIARSAGKRRRGNQSAQSLCALLIFKGPIRKA